jgi:myo-inositol-1(or 4)-monophosphatase
LHRLQALIEALIRVVRDVARAELLPRFREASHARFAKSDGSFSTAADHAAQAELMRRLIAIRDVPVLSEETTLAEQIAAWQAGDAGLWVVDPLDGTTNFAAGLPYFAVSVAFMVRGRTTLGVVYNPATDELFHASVGGGAFLGDERLPLRTASIDLSGAVVAIEPKRLPRALAERVADEAPFHSMRNFGAGTLHWCHVAVGRFDAFLNGAQELWDYAAGSLVLAEAGGCMGTIEEDDFWAGDKLRRSVVAARDAPLYAQWKHWVRSHAGVAE